MATRKTVNTSKKRGVPTMKIPAFVVDKNGNLINVYLRDRIEFPESRMTVDQVPVSKRSRQVKLQP
jgi:hypothetical protein